MERLGCHKCNRKFRNESDRFRHLGKLHPESPVAVGPGESGDWQLFEDKLQSFISIDTEQDAVTVEIDGGTLILMTREGKYTLPLPIPTQTIDDISLKVESNIVLVEYTFEE